MKASALWLGASALAFAWCGTAAAQDAPQSDSDQSVQEHEDDIIVTAQRRNENLMTTPTAASVLSGEQLENKGVNDVDALQFAMPSVVVNNFGQGNDFNVRGIGKAEHNTQTTTGVIVYRDGVPTFPGYVTKEPYFDIANIQVLRGPQGTIVGQNATGGAVFVNTNDPIIGGGFHGYVQAQYGNYQDVGMQGALNIPVSDTLAMRVSGYAERRDGFYDITGTPAAPYTGGNGGLKMYAGRFSLIFQPTENFSITSKTDLAYMDFGGYPASPYWQSMETLPNGSPNPRYADLFTLTANAPDYSRDKMIRSILKMEYDTNSGLKFRSITSFQAANTKYGTDLDGTNSTYGNPITGAAPLNWSFNDNVSETQVSQEFNIISPDNQRFTWLVGAFGLWNSYFFLSPFDNFTTNVCYPITTIPACKYQLKGRNVQHSLAAFGQVGFAITPNLKIEAGARYTDTNSTNRGDILQYGTPLSMNQRTESDNLSYKVSLGWKADSSNYLYGFVATGFRPGGLNVPVSSAALLDPFKPERVTSFEAGWKANWAGGKIRTTIDAFYNNYKNFQVIVGYPDLPTFNLELNVPDTTKIYGFEAEAEIRLGRLSLDAGINVLHSELGTFFAVDRRRVPTGVVPAPCNPATGPAATYCIDLTGQRQTYAPNMTFNIGGQYEFVFGNGDKLIPRANFGHIGDQWATLFENASFGDRIKARNILNAQLAFQHGSYTLTAYATNLTNQHYPAALNSGLYFAGPPRQYGVKLFKIF